MQQSSKPDTEIFGLEKLVLKSWIELSITMAVFKVSFLGLVVVMALFSASTLSLAHPAGFNFGWGSGWGSEPSRGHGGYAQAGGSFGLFPQFYQFSCPQANDIVISVLQQAIAREPRAAASLLRLHFHDCFVQVIFKFKGLSLFTKIIYCRH